MPTLAHIRLCKAFLEWFAETYPSLFLKWREEYIKLEEGRGNKPRDHWFVTHLHNNKWEGFVPYWEMFKPIYKAQKRLLRAAKMQLNKK